jgi:hypothetical protein
MIEIFLNIKSINPCKVHELMIIESRPCKHETIGK